MNILYLTVFASLGLAGLGLLLFLHSAGQRDRDHIERLALLPLDDDDDFRLPPVPPVPPVPNEHPPQPATRGPHR